MRFEIMGGDERLRELALLLSDEGHEVLCFAMDKAELPENIRKVERPENADCVILPLPAESGRLGTLNAPFSSLSYSASRLLSSLDRDSLVCAGKLSPRLRGAASEGGIRLCDYMTRPEFTVGNAAITAEAAVSRCMSETAYTVFGSRVLVIGWGRIGKLTAIKLSALGASVTVLSRNPEARALAAAMGFGEASPETGCDALTDFDIVINTAPAPVLSEAQLRAVRPDCFVLELASAPGGIDADTAEKCGFRYAVAPGLPGRYAPRSAAKLIRDAVMNIVKEHENV